MNPDVPRLDSRSYIAAIRANNLAAARLHTESGRFAEGVLQLAMNLAAYCGHRRLLCYFLDLKHSGRCSFLDPSASLAAAAAAGKVQGIAELRALGADVHCDEDFPYYLALNRDHPVTSFYLQFAGVDPGANEHALRSAYRRGRRELVFELCALATQAPTPAQGLAWSVRTHKLKVALGALLAGADPAANDSEVLFQAIESGQDELIRLLCEHGADVLARGERILLDTARQSRSGSTLRTVHHFVQQTRRQPTYIPAGTGRTQGLKAIAGSAEFCPPPPSAPRIVPTLRPYGRGWREMRPGGG